MVDYTVTIYRESGIDVFDDNRDDIPTITVLPSGSVMSFTSHVFPEDYYHIEIRDNDNTIITPSGRYRYTIDNIQENHMIQIFLKARYESWFEPAQKYIKLSPLKYYFYDCTRVSSNPTIKYTIPHMWARRFDYNITLRTQNCVNTFTYAGEHVMDFWICDNISSYHADGIIIGIE